MKLYNETQNNNNDYATINTICDLCVKLAEVEFLNIVRLNEIDVNNLRSINDIEDFTDINVLGMTYYLTERLTTDALIRIAEKVQYHINKEVIPHIGFYNSIYMTKG